VAPTDLCTGLSEILAVARLASFRAAAAELRVVRDKSARHRTPEGQRTDIEGQEENQCRRAVRSLVLPKRYRGC